jgi:hypothetical protein
MQIYFTSPVCTIIKRITLLITIQFIYLFSTAQSYTGYHSSAYAGVYSILNNPADILNHRTRADINLIGFSTALSNNIFAFKFKNRNDDNGGFSYPNPIKKDGKLNFNADIFGPSVMIKLSDKNAFAVTTRARAFTNVHGISNAILNSLLPDVSTESYLGKRLAISNASVNMHTWKEVALTYSRQIAHTDFGVWKAGITLKYLGGVAAFSLSSNNLSYIHDSIIDPRDGKTKDALINATGNINISYTKSLDSLSDDINDYLSFKNPGAGLDIGVSYEYRDEMQVYETSYSDKTANYIWKAGASITDIGFISYNKEQTKSMVNNFSGKTYTVDTLVPPSDSNDIYQMANYYNNLFNARTESSLLTMQLPTTLHLSYDRYFNKWLGVQAQLNIPLVFSKLNFYTGNYTPVSICITPRAEISWAGLYMPISYNSISRLNVGTALRLGPLVIGSSSIINARAGKTKGLDVYFILRIPIFGYREYKNKIYGQQTPKLTRKQRRELHCPTN